jgi:hypothetical protein
MSKLRKGETSKNDKVSTFLPLKTYGLVIERGETIYFSIRNFNV